MHTNVALFIVMELFVTFRQYPTRKTGVISLTVFMLGYVTWIHIIKHVSGKWVYPILEVLNLPQRIAFIAFIGVFCISFYFVGEFLNNTVWAKEIKTTKKQKWTHSAENAKQRTNSDINSIYLYTHTAIMLVLLLPYLNWREQKRNIVTNSTQILKSNLFRRLKKKGLLCNPI